MVPEFPRPARNGFLMQPLRSEPARVVVSAAGAADAPAYGAFLAEIEESLIYYSLPFKAFLEDLLGCGSEYWIAREAGRITGVLPVMWRDGPLGRIINSLPFYGSIGGALAITAEAEAALTHRFNELAVEPGVAAATWVSHPQRIPSAEVAHDLTDKRIGQITALDLPGDSETALLAMVEGSTRRNIRKAESSGVEVHVRNDCLDFLESVHRENMAQIGGKAKPAAFFRKIPAHLRPGRDYKLYVAERGGNPVAALLLLYFHRTVEYYVPVTREPERPYQPMALILWRAMLEAARAGYRQWNWGGTWLSQTGVWRFKRKWGAKDHPYNYFVKVNACTIMTSTRAQLLDGYPDFFVVPFDRLRVE
jgi:hypothetical protein